MGRWGNDARGRLEEAALALYTERGFEQTTVAEIAERAGLTERTFFRHFADKREVLFSGAGLLKTLVVDGVEAAPPGTSPMAAVMAGLEAAGTRFQAAVPHSRQRQRVIDANAELQARELSKLAALSVAVADALRRRGVGDPAAALTAEAGVLVFKTVFERWIGEAAPHDWSRLVWATLDELRAVTASG